MMLFSVNLEGGEVGVTPAVAVGEGPGVGGMPLDSLNAITTIVALFPLGHVPAGSFPRAVI